MSRAITNIKDISITEINKYSEIYILPELEKKGFIFLDKELIYPSEKYSELKYIYSVLTNTSLSLSSIEDYRQFYPIYNVNELTEEINIIKDYIEILKKIKIDGRSLNSIRLLIYNSISKINGDVEINNSNSKYLYLKKTVDLVIINSLIEYISHINEISNDEYNEYNIFYRGHSNVNWKLIPSIYRDKLVYNEHNMFRDIILRNPNEFKDAKSTFDRLTIMQHYGLPTRLLDITKSPLVALFFAINGKDEFDTPGEVIVFKPSKKLVKYYDSDTVSILSNIAKAERNLKIVYDKNSFNKSIDGLKLLHLIKAEKPYFLGQIEPNDLEKKLFVKPINNNERIKNQLGYFILFGVNNLITQPVEIDDLVYKKNNKRLIILIDESSKKEILRELSNIGVNSNMLFPEIENGSSFIKNNYMNKG